VPRCCRKPRRAAGFSLLEVLAALVVAGLALAAAAGALGTGMRGHRTAADVDAAIAFAEDLLAASGVADELRPGASGGTFAGRFTWHRDIAPYADPAQGRLPEHAGPGLYRVAVTVAWQDGTASRRIALSTLRLAP
jgi:general secretion pathway protein I